ncbi:D-alanine transaminase [Formivibrio citricus]|uniref:branched-chain-amino-acid transaminase n=1 Tax=Formivibrio citricus TaxID=83765 RepID=A0A1I5AC69_9NEIS|nr:D-amino acid aminotransferase [Formivibrio citricus]SFN59988.1 D-alanine transaminase [Formivibrio citricus]
MLIPDITGYLNGRYAPLAELQVSVLDRGFLFGDGVYELVPVYDRRPFRLREHLARLDRSLSAVGIANPHTTDEWVTIVEEIVARHEFGDQSVYLQVSRGPAWPRNHAFPHEVTPTVFGYAEPLLPPAQELIERGIKAVSAADIRWGRCNIKSCSLIGNVLLKQVAAEAGAAEVVLFRDGFLVEGGASNVFVVKRGALLAPPPSHQMLTGITYDVVLELARHHGMALEVREIEEREARGADEMWISSSSKEVLAVTELDGRSVGNGVPGPIYRRMYDFYQVFKTTEMRSK